MYDTMCALLFLTCVHVALSVDVINVIELQPGELVSGNVSLKASDTYSVTQSSTVPYRVRTTVAGVNGAFIAFVVREHENVLKWVMPSRSDSFRSNISLLATEHTLVPCFVGSPAILYIDVFTDSVTPMSYTLLVEELELFNLSVSKYYNTTISLAQPQIYYFEFPAGMDAVTINATSNDNTTCAFLSVQSTSTCPPVDTLYNAIVMGTDQAMTANAFFTITRERLGQSSFYLVLIPASSAFCRESFMSDENGDNYTKQITFSVRQADTLYMHLLEVWLPMVVMLVGSALAGALYCCYISICLCHPTTCVDLLHHVCCAEDPANSRMTGTHMEGNSTLQDSEHRRLTKKDCLYHVCCAEVPAISRVACYMYCCKCTHMEGNSISQDGERSRLTKESAQTEVEGCKNNSYGSPLTGANLTMKQLNEGDSGKTHLYEDLLRTNESDLRMSHFSNINFQTMKVRYTTYICNVVTVGIYYGIPALQVVFAKAIAQQMAFPIYKEDEKCYYNYQCAIALGYVPAVNNVLSNSGYVVMGIVFVVIVSVRECYYNKKWCFKRAQVSKGSGLTPGNGLYYAMGFALIGEGVMSALYHVCPSNINFQFDTTFMFIIGGLIIAKMMQNRHPYFNANSFCAFWGFSVVTLVTIIGLYVDRDNPVPIRVALLFVLLVIAAIFYFSLYHFNQLAVLTRPKMWKLRKSRLVKLTCALCFDCLVIAVLFFYNRLDIATTILTLFALNGVVLLAWYLGSKCFHSEPRMALPVIILLLALGLWIVAGIYFEKKIYNSGTTPVESRELNKPCFIGGFYDYHDFWHFMSATAIFTTFMGMLTLDDGLKMKEHSEIHVF